MKITNIEQTGKVYTITETPNFFEKLFGRKEKQSKYKETDWKYNKYPDIPVLCNQEGEILSVVSKPTTAIENWKRRF